MPEKNTTIQSIIAIIFKEFRLQINATQAEFADRCNKQQSSWNKIENGSMSISLENILMISNSYNIDFVFIFDLARKYQYFLQHNGWYISPKEKIEQDGLFTSSKLWFDSDFSTRNNIRMDDILTPKGEVIRSPYLPDILQLPSYYTDPERMAISYVHPLFKAIVYPDKKKIGNNNE